MGSYGSLFTVMLLDINKGVELFIYTLKTSLTCLNMEHVSRAVCPHFQLYLSTIVEQAVACVLATQWARV